jgi:hypothetical protein
MRIATILAILARCINQYIFQPTYILDEEDEIRPLLVRLAAVKSEKESFFRALLLSIFPEEQTENAVKAVERVVKEVASCVWGLLSVAQYENFRLDLAQVAQQACDAWRSMQYAKEKFELYFDLTYYEDLPWHVLRFEEGGACAREQASTGISKGDEELLVIFPRVYVVENAEPDPITNGVVLMKSQTTAAAEEIERNNPSSPTAGKAGPRPRPNRSRTKSSSLNGGNDFLSEPTPSKRKLRWFEQQLNL